MRKKNILVAGGTGLVGTNLTKRLLGLGAYVLSSYYSEPPEPFLACHESFDFRDFNDCLAATKYMDYVIICAAQTYGIKIMKEKPTISILPNLEINAGLFEACKINKVERVILISSATVYQESDYPIEEELLDLNKPPYSAYFGVGWLNRYIEKLAEFYYETSNMNIGIIRTTNIYGPHDKFDDDKSHVIPALIKRALNKELPYKVWGDGQEIRDFIYVDDFVDDLLDVLNGYCICEPINVASGELVSIREAVEVILKACKHKCTPEYDISKPTAIRFRALDLSKFDDIFGDKKRTSFEEGIRRTVRFRLKE